MKQVRRDSSQVCSVQGTPGKNTYTHKKKTQSEYREMEKSKCRVTGDSCFSTGCNECWISGKSKVKQMEHLSLIKMLVNNGSNAIDGNEVSIKHSKTEN